MSEQDSTPRAVVYHRVARDTPDTPGGQLEAVERYAKAHGYEILPPFWRKADAPEADLIITDAEPVTEYGSQSDGKIYCRRVIVLEDWAEVTGEQSSARDYAATHPIVCAHADDDSQDSHILAPGEKCDRGKP